MKKDTRKLISLKLTEEKFAEIEAYCKAKQMTKSDLLRAALSSYMNKN